MIVADDLGWDDVSFHGSDQIPTPHIDALASTGIILNNYYVSPICTPSRGALLSGKHPIHLGLQHDVIYAGEPWGLPKNVTILPQHLKHLGYSTHGIGKWHLGFFKTDRTPTKRGFDSHFGYYTGHEDYYDHTAMNDIGWGTDFHEDLSTERDAVGKYTTELFTDRAVNIIKSHNSSKPLFLYLAHLAVHVANSYSLFQAPRKYVDKFPHIRDERRRTFAGMISALDESVGNVLQSLNDASMLDNTIIVFTTDNGGAAGGIDSGVGCNWPLRGSKYTLWEGGVRGNAIFWSSQLPKTKGGRQSDQLMHITDWLPTLYTAAGGDVKDLGLIYGVNMLKSLMEGMPSARKEILHNIDPIWKSSALRWNDYKIVVGSVFNGEYDGWYPRIGDGETNSVDIGSSTKLLLQRRGWKVSEVKRYQVECGPRPENSTTNCQPLKRPCLFNITNDPCEYHNIADEHPKILGYLTERLNILNSSAIPPANLPVDPKASPRCHDYAWVPWLDDEIRNYICK